VRKALLGVSLLAAWAGLGGCLETEDPEEDCTPTPFFCERSSSGSADLTIQVSSPLPSQVKVFKGSSFETGTVVWQGAPTGSSWSLRLPSGDYSATASYQRGTQTIVAADGAYVGYEAMETCDGTCYDEVDGLVDLELETP
jgi:hypothetical protein